MCNWKNWCNCPYCGQGHLQYNGYTGGEILTVFYKCSRCGKEISLTDEWEKIAETILEREGGVLE